MHVESGIASSGVAFGTFALAPLLRYLVTNEGWKTCNRVLAVICLSCIIFGAMMIPLKNKSFKEENEGEDTKLLEVKRNSKSLPKCILKILKRRSFILLGMSTFTGGMGLIILFTFIPGVDTKNN